MHAAAETGRSEDDASEGGCRFTMSVVRLELLQKFGVFDGLIFTAVRVFSARVCSF